MNELNNITKSNFSISFGGENEIEVKTLVNSLKTVMNLIEYVSKEIEGCNDIKIKIKDTQKGSFEVNFEVIASVIPFIFTVQNINLAKTCIETICGLINIKKHLKGEKPKKVEREGGNVIIENNHAETIIVDNRTFMIYGQATDKLITDMFSGNEREHLMIKVQNEEKVVVKKEEYGYMTTNINVEEERVITNTFESVFAVKKPDLIGNSKWQLVDMRSKKIIEATIDDSIFIDKIHRCEISINARTLITAVVKIESTLNLYNESIKDVYTVLDVLDFKNENYEQIKCML